MDWFLYDRDFRNETVNAEFSTARKEEKDI